MDESTPVQENNPSPVKNRLSSLLIGISAGIVFLLTIFLILNYFNSISLSTIYPNQFGWLPHQGPSDSEVVATINNQKITRGEVLYTKKLLEGPLKGQKAYGAKIDTSVTFENALGETKRIIQIQQEAKKSGITITDQEIDEYKNQGVTNKNKDLFTSLLGIYGWTETDWKNDARNKLLFFKVEKQVIFWKDVQIIAVRWDYMDPATRPPLVSLKADAQLSLGSVAKAFDDGKPFADVFNIALQHNTRKQFLVQRIGNINPLNRDKEPLLHVTNDTGMADDLKAFIFKTTLPSQSQTFCTNTACYLIKFLDGNNGQYASMDAFYSGKKITL